MSSSLSFPSACFFLFSAQRCRNSAVARARTGRESGTKVGGGDVGLLLQLTSCRADRSFSRLRFLARQRPPRTSLRDEKKSALAVPADHRRSENCRVEKLDSIAAKSIQSRNTTSPAHAAPRRARLRTPYRYVGHAFCALCPSQAPRRASRTTHASTQVNVHGERSAAHDLERRDQLRTGPRTGASLSRDPVRGVRLKCMTSKTSSCRLLTRNRSA